ncbi:hypothetical protein D9M68_683640 [compost metagenome]
MSCVFLMSFSTERICDGRALTNRVPEVRFSVKPCCWLGCTTWVGSWLPLAAEAGSTTGERASPRMVLRLFSISV